MKHLTVIFAALMLLAAGCAQPMKLSAQRWGALRADGTVVPAYIVTDTTLPPDSYEALAICVTPLGSDPLDSLEALAGACAAGCKLLLTQAHVTIPDDQLLVLRQYLESVSQKPRSVLVISLGSGAIVATSLAIAEPRVTHVVLLGPREYRPDVRQPTFVARIGPRGRRDLPPNFTTRDYPESDQHWRELDTGRTIRPLVEMDVIAWLTDTGALTNERAKRLAKRVKANHPEWYSSRSDE